MPLGLIHHLTVKLVIGQYIGNQLETKIIAIEHINNVNISTFTFEYPTFNLKTYWALCPDNIKKEVTL